MDNGKKGKIEKEKKEKEEKEEIEEETTLLTAAFSTSLRRMISDHQTTDYQELKMGKE